MHRAVQEVPTEKECTSQVLQPVITGKKIDRFALCTVFIMQILVSVSTLSVEKLVPVNYHLQSNAVVTLC